jgi:L-seryl-tRNA(Ser) seleniumtransferase
LLEDLGGGALVDLSACGLSLDPLVRDSVAAGADVVTFSTDKILGGPQGGVLVGRPRAIEAARRDPLARALRMGRLPLVALEATLASYLEGDLDGIPALAMSRRSADVLLERVQRWVDVLADRASIGVHAEPRASKALAGGGTYAEEEIASWALALVPDDPELLASRLRAGTPAVLARVERDVVLIDARTVLDGEDGTLLSAIREAWGSS